MALTQLAPPYPIFTDKNGDPLDAGFVYFGEPNLNPETNPIQVYYDRGFTQPAAQPLRTSNGYIMRSGSPALIYADSQFSVTVRDKNNALVIYSPVGFGVVPGVPFATFENAAIDVVALLADTNFTYSSGIPGSVQVVAGDVLRTLAEGFAYEVADAAATDFNIETSGGVKLYVDTSPATLNVKAFGIFPSNAAATNDTRLIAMRNRLRAVDNDRLWRLLFEPGQYEYTDNKWTRGIKHLEITGYGAVLYNSLNDPIYAKMRVFNESTPFYTSGDAFSNTVTYFGQEIDTLLAGTKVATFKTTGDAADYTVGDRILVASRDVQFGGFPSNYSKFQYTSVTSVDTGAGTITLNDAALYDYQDDDPHASNGYGKARIFNLDRGLSDYVHPETRILRGVRLKQNPNRPNPQGEVLTGDYVLWDEVEFDGVFQMWPSIGKTIEVASAKAVNGGVLGSEPDKLVSTCLFRDFNHGGATYAATGVHQITFKNMVFGSSVDISSQELTVYDSCKIANSGFGPFGIVKASIPFGPGAIHVKNSQFSAPVSEGYSHAINAQATSAAIPYAVPATDNLQFDLSVFSGRSIVGRLRVGDIIYSQDGTDFGTVRSISQTTGLIVDVFIDWFKEATPSTSKTYQTASKQAVLDLGGNKMSGVSTLFRESENYSSRGYITGGEGLRYGKVSRFIPASRFVAAGGNIVTTPFGQSPRIINSITIDVHRPYSGVSASPSLYFAMNSSSKGIGGGTYQQVTINPLTAGRRIIYPGGNIGFVTGDSSSMTAQLQNFADLYMRQGAGSPDYSGGEADAPIVSIEIDFVVPGMKV